MNNDGHYGGFLRHDNYPNWFTFYSEGSSVIFEVPRMEGRVLKTMICIVDSWTFASIASDSDGLKNVMAKNFTKSTIQVYKRGISFL
jgi:hypothetical protein